MTAFDPSILIVFLVAKIVVAFEAAITFIQIVAVARIFVFLALFYKILIALVDFVLLLVVLTIVLLASVF